MKSYNIDISGLDLADEEIERVRSLSVSGLRYAYLLQQREHDVRTASAQAASLLAGTAPDTYRSLSFEDYDAITAWFEDCSSPF